VRTSRPDLVLTLLVAASLAGCGGAGAETAGGGDIAVVDSVLPMPVMLDRFRAGILEPTRLASGADSRDGLVRDVVRALETADTASLARLTVGLAEWAWLYFPTSVQAHPPYELPPGLAWFQLEEGNRRAVLRALDRLGGSALEYHEHTCPRDPAAEGDNRVWTGCLVRVTRPGGEPSDLRLFSAILERDGRFAILSWTNDF